MDRIPVAIVGSGNIGTDLAKKLLRSDGLRPVAMIGIDPQSDGLAQGPFAGGSRRPRPVRRLAASRTPSRLGVRIVFEATSAARSTPANAPRYEAAGLVAIDLTPAAVGPAVVPPVNLRAHLDAPEPEHDHVRRPGHDPDRRGRLPG